MFHIKVSCQKSLALTWMNSQCSSPSLPKSSIPFLGSQCLRSEFRVETFSSYLPLFPQALSGSRQLSSPSFSPSVSLHISLGLVPLIKHSCRAHRKAPLFFTLLYKLAGCLSQALALLILGDVSNCCLCLGHRAESAGSFDSGHSTNT